MVDFAWLKFGKELVFSFSCYEFRDIFRSCSVHQFFWFVMPLNKVKVLVVGFTNN